MLLKSLLFIPNTSIWAQNVLNIELKYVLIKLKFKYIWKISLNFDRIRHEQLSN